MDSDQLASVYTVKNDIQKNEKSYIQSALNKSNTVINAQTSEYIHSDLLG